MPSDQLVAIVRARGLRQLPEPVRLASGDWSRWFVDAKRALARGDDLRVAAEALLEAVGGVGFDAVGGLTMGADHLAHGVAVVAGDVEWFSVRKQAKDRGTAQRVEGAELGPGRRVLLVDDVVTRGGSLLDALAAVDATGATVAAATTLVDRGAFDADVLAARGIPYRPLLRHTDLGIPAVGSEETLQPPA